MPHAMIVYNPISGRFQKEKMVDRVAQRLEMFGWEAEVFPSENPQHITRLAEQASDDGYTAFFVAGGDGSIGLAAKGLIHSKTALGVLPAGTSNVWSKEFHLAGLTWHNLTALENAAEKQIEGRLQAVDVGTINDQAFLLWAGVGLGAHVVHQMEADRKNIRRFTILKYAQTVLKNIRTWKGIDLRIKVDDEEIEGRYIFAVISNIRKYAGGLSQISPAACLDDGQMDLWLFNGNSPIESLRALALVLSNRHPYSKNVKRIPFRNLEIFSDSPLYFQVDGDSVKTEKEVKIGVDHLALNKLVPNGISDSLFQLPGFGWK